ncbi:MAG: signal peptidase I [bacterium]|nr:signal peptidase I [bacterium]
MKKKIRNIIFAVFCIIFIPVLIINFIIMIKSFINPNEVPGIFGYKPMMVMTASMEDTIMTGDLVFVKKCENKELKVGDIISYRDNYDTIITHRIIEIIKKDNEIKYITKGDNNNTEDSEYVTQEQIEGIYVGKIAKLGGFLEFIQTPVGIAIILLFIVFFV